ncbi:hypothetical protein DOTSEDRAFT_72827 [Dothistroma septosporum NZE10]|uniref:CENP-V/GFA domain-containing protein n=1 Tax=Dothistroma septosporum (strain NZE10 / CBS 128990) TaxID=675120 RepID=M2Y5R6_DOTSN|nr:hypothetical protein DOTSEDRAFT_72827 [Dothistroma septosporum NZE10]
MSSHPAKPSTPWPEETGVWATYNLHCHCGAVRLNVKVSPPFFESEAEGKGTYPVTECDCSYCERQGYQAVHPLQSNVCFTQGQDNLTKYYCGNKQNPHLFCKHCGSVMMTDLTAMGKFLPGDPRYTVNVRMLEDYDSSKLTIQKVEFMKNMPPKYTID